MQFASGFTYFQELQFSFEVLSNGFLLEVLYDLLILLVLISQGYYSLPQKEIYLLSLPGGMAV